MFVVLADTPNGRCIQCIKVMPFYDKVLISVSETESFVVDREEFLGASVENPWKAPERTPACN